MVAVGEGLNVLEANMKRPLQVRAWMAAGVLRPWHSARRDLSGGGRVTGLQPTPQSVGDTKESNGNPSSEASRGAAEP